MPKEKIVKEKEQNQKISRDSKEKNKAIQKNELNISKQTNSFKNKINNFEHKQKEEEKPKPKFIPKQFDKSKFDFIKKKDNKEKKSDPIPKKFDKIRLTFSKNNQEKKEKPKIKPNKLDMNNINQKMNEDKINKEKNKSVKEEIINCVDFKNKVLKFTSSSKEGEKNNEKEKEKEKISPKNLTNIDNRIKEMNKNNNA